MSSRVNGILAYGVYIPRARLQRSAVVAANGWFNNSLKSMSEGERAMSSWDEDSITMAVEASRDCFGELDRNCVSSILFASTSAPYADRQNAGIVKEALNLRDDIGCLDVGGGQRAGTSSLIQALHSNVDNDHAILCVASDKHKSRAGSQSELLHGDASAALLIGNSEPLAEFIGSHSVTVDFVDHFRSAHYEFDYGWESRWIRDEGYNKILRDGLQSALTKLQIPSARVDHFIVAVAAGSVPIALAKMLNIKQEAVRNTLNATVGYAGVAHPALMLAKTLEIAKPGESIVMASFGQGCDILAFKATEALARSRQRSRVTHWLNRRVPEKNYIKFLSFNGLLDLDKGMRAEAEFKQSLSALYRNRKTVLGLVGGRSTTSGAVQFPRSEISVDLQDDAVGTQEDYVLAERAARVVSHTADDLCHSLDPPMYYGMIEFDGGGRMIAEFVDVDAESLSVGSLVRMVFRIKEFDARRGFTKYFWKATPHG